MAKFNLYVRSFIYFFCINYLFCWGNTRFNNNTTKKIVFVYLCCSGGWYKNNTKQKIDEKKNFFFNYIFLLHLSVFNTIKYKIDVPFIGFLSLVFKYIYIYIETLGIFDMMVLINNAKEKQNKKKTFGKA